MLGRGYRRKKENRTAVEQNFFETEQDSLDISSKSIPLIGLRYAGSSRNRPEIYV